MNMTWTGAHQHAFYRKYPKRLRLQKMVMGHYEIHYVMLMLSVS